MAGTGDIDHIQVILADDPVQMHIDKVLAGRSAPVPEQHRLDVLRPERRAKQGIITEIELADRQIIGRAPVGVNFTQLFG